MKRSLKISLVFAVLAVMSLFCTSAYADDTVRSSAVQAYNGVIYTSYEDAVGKYCKATVGDTVYTNTLRALPSNITRNNDIYFFAIYYDKIYYFVEGGSGNYIYRCNLNGSNNELVTANVGYSRFYLSNGYLFYDYFRYETYYTHYIGGIMRLNLNTGEFKKIVTDSDAYIIKVLGDKLFYSTQGNDRKFLMTTNGAYLGPMSDNDIEVCSDLIIGNTAYTAYGGAIYAEDWNRNSHWICNIPAYLKGYETYNQYAYIENVIGGYVYYSLDIDMGDHCDIALLQAPLSSGPSSIIAQWGGY